MRPPKPTRVVAVLGIGHLNGVLKNFDRDLAEEAEQYTRYVGCVYIIIQYTEYVICMQYIFYLYSTGSDINRLKAL